MDSQTEMVIAKAREGYEVREIARRMGMSEEWVGEILANPELGKEKEESPPAVVYTTEEIKGRLEGMFADALGVVQLAMQAPHKVTPTQWQATRWVLEMCPEIQELLKSRGEDSSSHYFYVGERAAAALEKLLGEGSDPGWQKQMLEELAEMPDGIE